MEDPLHPENVCPCHFKPKRISCTLKSIGSGRMEKGVDQVIGYRQKKKGMSWSQKGSKALAILKVVELNSQWEQIWFPERKAA